MVRKVISVAVGTNVIAFVTASASWIYVRECFKDNRPTKPVVAITVLLCLFMGTVSIYQIFLSTLLICQEIRKKNRVFTNVLWYVSHVNLLILAFMLMTFRVAACAVHGQMLAAALMGLFEVFYLAVFAYFLRIVNQHISEIDEERYF